MGDVLSGEGFEGEGLRWAYDNGEWCVGIKNYKPQNGIDRLDNLELHEATDESFMLLDGHCCLLLRGADGAFQAGMMDRGRLYTVPAGIWHTTVTAPGVKLILVERSGTSMANSRVQELDDSARTAARTAVMEAGFPAQ